MKNTSPISRSFAVSPIRIKRLAFLMAAGAFLLGSSFSVRGLTLDSWLNAGGTNYNTAGDWSANVAPSSGYYADFGGAEVSNPVLTASYTSGAIYFSATAAGYDLTSTNGATLSLAGDYSSSIVVEGANASGANMIAAPIDFLEGTTSAVTLSFQQALGGTLILSGPLSFGNSGDAFYFGSQGGSQGTIAILGSDNVLSGGAELDAGTLTVVVSALATSPTAAGSLGTGTISFYGSDTLNYTGSGEVSDQTITFINPDNAASPGISTLGATGALTITSNISDTATLTAGETDTLVLTSYDNYGDTYSGVLSNAIGTYTETSALEKLGTGEWTLNNQNTYTGGTDIGQGTLNLSFANYNSNIISASSALTLGGGSYGTANLAGTDTLLLTGASGATDSQAFASTSLFPGASHIVINDNGGTVTLSLGAIPVTLSYYTGATLDIDAPAGSVTTTTGPSGTYPLLLTDAVTLNGTDFATLTSNGAGAYEFVPTTYTQNGTTTLTTNKVIDMSNGSSSIATSTQIAALRFNNAGATTLTIGTGDQLQVSYGVLSSNGYGSGAILVTPNVGSYTTDITGGTLVGLQGGNNPNQFGELELLQNNTNGILEIDSIIANASTLYGDNLVKSGLGTAVLTGANTYTGSTIINEGTLEIANTAGGSTPLGVGSTSTGSTYTSGSSTNYSIDGTFYISIGTGAALQIGNGTTAGAGNINNTLLGISDAGTVLLDRPDTFTFSNEIFSTSPITSAAIDNLFSGGLTQEGSGTAVINILNNYTGPTTISNGILSVGSAGTATVASGSATLTKGSTVVTVTSTSGLLVGQNVTGTGIATGSVIVSIDSATTITISAPATAAESSETVAFGTGSSLANGGVSSSIGDSSNLAQNLVLDGGTLQYTGAAQSTDRLFTVTANGGTLDGSGTGALVFTNTGSEVASGTGSRTLDLIGSYAGGSAAAANTIDSVIADPTTSGSTGVTKAGAGSWTLAGTNTYSGNTTVQSGILYLSSSTTNNNIGTSANIIAGDSLADAAAVLDVTGISTSGGFQVQSGQTLSGFGTVNGNTTTLSGSTVSPGTSGTVGTLAITNGNLTLNQGTKFLYDLNGVGTSDQITVSGTLTLNNQQFTDFTFNTLTSVSPGQQYDLMVSNAAIAGTLGTDTTGTVDGYMASIDISGDDLLLEVASVPEPSTWTLVLGGVFLLGLYQRRRRSS